MGMDVCGTGNEAAYFRNNVWYWHPLWNYCAAVAPEIIDPALAESGHMNDGTGLDEEGALALARKLEAEIDSGRTEAYSQAYAARIAALPEEPCEYCEGTGYRHGFESKSKRAKAANKCGVCDGKGKRQSFEANYPFATENVAEFVEFLKVCGGFHIL